MKIKSGLNLEKKRIVWRIQVTEKLKKKKKIVTVRNKLFEILLKTIDWKAIWKLCATIICCLHFDRTSRINCKKYDEKCYDQWYYWMCTNNKGKCVQKCVQ